MSIPGSLGSTIQQNNGFQGIAGGLGSAQVSTFNYLPKMNL